MDNLFFEKDMKRAKYLNQERIEEAKIFNQERINKQEGMENSEKRSDDK